MVQLCIPYQVDWPTKLFLAHGVISGMEYLHSAWPHPVIHGDLTIQNVLVGDDLIAKVRVTVYFVHILILLLIIIIIISQSIFIESGYEIHMITCIFVNYGNQRTVDNWRGNFLYDHNEQQPIISQPQCGRYHRAGTGQATLEVIGSKQ